MNFYFAPLEGITGYVYRRVHHELFGFGIDRYYAPFVVASYTRKLKTRERMDILPENNTGVPLVPQILANDADCFLATARAMAELGYQEVNINLGCPVGTVVSKHKGAGMLQFPEELDRFLDGVYEGAGKIPIRVSVKTRLGFYSIEEAPRIFAIYEQYPISELIVHARTRQEQYNGQPEIAAFLSLLKNTRLPVCYNGNIASVQDFYTWQGCLHAADNTADSNFSTSHSRQALSGKKLLQMAGSSSASLSASHDVDCMIGRGLVGNPGLVREILTGQKTTREDLLTFHQRLLSGYEEQYLSFRGQTSGQTVIINRMKEVWTHLGQSFANSDKYLKAIHKAKNRTEYDAAVRMLFANCDVTAPVSALQASPSSTPT